MAALLICPECQVTLRPDRPLWVTDNQKEDGQQTYWWAMRMACPMCDGGTVIQITGPPKLRADRPGDTHPIVVFRRI